jgi:hypothetical protein
MAMVTLTPTLIRIIFQRTELTHFMKNLHNGQTVMVMDLATTLKD